MHAADESPPQAAIPATPTNSQLINSAWTAVAVSHACYVLGCKQVKQPKQVSRAWAA
jgi:hypothetical protein